MSRSKCLARSGHQIHRSARPARTANHDTHTIPARVRLRSASNKARFFDGAWRPPERTWRRSIWRARFRAPHHHRPTASVEEAAGEPVALMDPAWELPRGTLRRASCRVTDWCCSGRLRLSAAGRNAWAPKRRNWRAPAGWRCSHYAEGRTAQSPTHCWKMARSMRLPDFTQPALIFHASTTMWSRGLSRRFVAAHPNATLEIVDSGHQMLNVLDSIAPKVTGFCCRSGPR